MMRRVMTISGAEGDEVIWLCGFLDMVWMGRGWVVFCDLQ